MSIQENALHLGRVIAGDGKIATGYGKKSAEGIADMVLSFLKENATDVVYEMLTKQAFSDWYEKDFVDHLQGEDDAKSKKEILADLKKMIEKSV